MSKGHNVWMSVSDLMTGLMIIFLFISISYISKVQENAVNLRDYVEVKNNLHDKLVNRFEGDTAKWVMSIGGDLSMKFRKSEVQFAAGSWQLTPQFEEILDEFLPKYFDILLNDSLRNHIEEIRIEGHTDDKPMPSLDPDPYIANVILSQRRALSVLRYFRNMEYFKNLPEDQQHTLEYWFTANGLSYGKALDNNNQYSFSSKKDINRDKSRRVEFRIITDSEKLLERFVEQNK